MDTEREKFRNYIEKSGVMSAFTDVLVRLYEEPNRPTDALTYIKDTLGTVNPDAQQMQLLTNKVKEQETLVESLQETIKAKDAEIAALKALHSEAEKEDANKSPPEGNADGGKTV